MSPSWRPDEECRQHAVEGQAFKLFRRGTYSMGPKMATETFQYRGYDIVPIWQWSQCASAFTRLVPIFPFWRARR